MSKKKQEVEEEVVWEVESSSKPPMTDGPVDPDARKALGLPELE